MGRRGIHRLSNNFISKEELIERFSFLEEWDPGYVEELYKSLKLKSRSEKRFNRVSQQEMDRFKSKNSILAVLNDGGVRGYIISFRISLIDQFTEESELSIKKILKKKMLKRNLFPRKIIYQSFR